MPDSAPGLPPRLIQLIARFRPDADGVGECALNVADVLFKDHAIPSDLLVYNPSHPGSSLEMPQWFPHTVEGLAAGGAGSFNRAIDRRIASSAAPPVLLVHYVSYGYSGQGTPFWLPRAIERFTSRGGRVLTLFHELYAGPRFPSRTFFNSWIQRRIFRRVLAASEAAFTSNEDYLALAQRDNQAHRPISLIGICSNAGEPDDPKPLALRTRRLAIFGRFTTRKQLYAQHLKALQRVVQHLGIEEIADVGSVDDPAWFEQNVAAPLGPLLRSYGMLPVSAVSRLFQDSHAGALVYPSRLLGKSGVVAAYQAHANAVLLFPESDEDRKREPGSWTLSPEELLALPAQSQALLERMQLAATAAHEHYNRHRSVRSMVRTLLPALQSARP